MTDQNELSADNISVEDRRALESVKDDLNVVDETETEKTSGARFKITSYGADLSVFDLRRRLGKDLLVPAPFQRKYVWNMRQASRFIESILLGLPVPGIFVFLKGKAQQIVDGQQRLITLDKYLSGIWEIKQRRQGSKIVDVVVPFTLVDVSTGWNGKTFEQLEKDDKDEIENYLIHTTIFRQDEPKKNDRSIYEVFERINTGGLRLSAQEIRACVSHGAFIEALGMWADDEKWRQIYGPRSPRLKDEELILRFFALNENFNDYRRPMRVFLDDFAESKLNITDQDLALLYSKFSQALDVALKLGDTKIFRPEAALNAAVFDAVMVGFSARLEKGPITDYEAIKVAYEKLLSNDDFRKYYLRATADDDSVKNRIKLSIDAFSTVK